MTEYRFTAGDNEAGVRLDTCLAELVEELSRSAVQKLISSGGVSVNGKAEKKNYILRRGDAIEIAIPEAEDMTPQAEDIPLDIVFEDEDIIVVNKPKGMVVHPAPGNFHGTLVNALLFHVGEGLREAGDGDLLRPGIVHRIDKDTGGLLVSAKTKRAYDGLHGQFATHSITRVYKALVYNVPEDEGTVDVPIGRDPVNRMKRAAGGIEPRRAVTHYRVLERMGNYTLIEAKLETGRTHQIRVHMAYIGCPLVGDSVYGPSRDKLGIEGQVLFAEKLGFRHPVTDEYMEFGAELPEYFAAAIAKAARRA